MFCTFVIKTLMLIRGFFYLMMQHLLSKCSFNTIIPDLGYVFLRFVIGMNPFQVAVVDAQFHCMYLYSF